MNEKEPLSKILKDILTLAIMIVISIAIAFYVRNQFDEPAYDDPNPPATCYGQNGIAYPCTP